MSSEARQILCHFTIGTRASLDLGLRSEPWVHPPEVPRNNWTLRVYIVLRKVQRNMWGQRCWTLLSLVHGDMTGEEPDVQGRGYHI